MTKDDRTGPAGERAGPATSTGPAGAATPWAERVRATYDDVRGPLWRALVAWSASPDVADEAVAEAFAQLLRRGEEVRDPAAWVWRSAFRLAAGDLKRRRLAVGSGGRDDAALARLAAAPDRLPDDALDLVRALAQLSEQQRRCVALVDVAGHTAPSAAAVLGTSAATVRVQLMRARRQLRALLAEGAEGAEVADGDASDRRAAPTAPIDGPVDRLGPASGTESPAGPTPGGEHTETSR